MGGWAINSPPEPKKGEVTIAFRKAAEARTLAASAVSDGVALGFYELTIFVALPKVRESLS